MTLTKSCGWSKTQHPLSLFLPLYLCSASYWQTAPGSQEVKENMGSLGPCDLAHTPLF